MTSMGLTARQEEILGFVKEYIAESGYPPSLREICAEFGIKGPGNAAKHLSALERKGFIRRVAGASRAIGLVEHGTGGPASVPIAGRVRAGEPHLAVEDVVGHVVMDSDFFKCDDAFLLKVVGESMIGAGIDDGDYVLVRSQRDANNAEIVVAMLGGEATVKRFFREDGVVILRPENPWMEQIVVKPDEEDEVEFCIVGKVISIIKRLEK